MEGKLLRVVNQYVYWHKGDSYGIIEVEDINNRSTHYFSRDPHISHAADCVPGLDPKGMGHLGFTIEEALKKIEGLL